MSLLRCSKDPTHSMDGYGLPQFCPECGAKVVSKRCEKCGALLNDRQKYCEQCGTAVERETKGGTHVADR